MELVRVTEAAAIASARWQGRGDKEAGDQAAVDAMEALLASVEMDAVVVIGEGEKDEAPMLANGQRVGTGRPPQVDLAVDPVEGTTLLAEGRPGALAMIAAAPRGSLFDPGPYMYMEKLAVSEDSADAIDLEDDLPTNLRRIAVAKRREVDELTVTMLARPRHKAAIEATRRTGARLQLIDHGDVAAGLAAVWSQRPGVDVLYGIGGTPEAVLLACGVHALGGRLLGRLWSRDEADHEAAAAADYDPARVLDTDDLARDRNCFFACTGITSGQLLAGVTFRGRRITTESLVMRGKSGTVRTINASHRHDKGGSYVGVAD